MTAPERPSPASHKPSFAELFTPKLVTILREGYGLRDLRADVVAGLTVAIVAIPLSMAIAIASGTTPDRGLFTARSEEHTSELQSLMRNSYAVFCLKKKNKQKP